ncbi:MAG: hypothetical protein Q8861_04975 [Bacteroidota bacterium]|nr:hypothetical protein [Bacteroidota bacterium]
MERINILKMDAEALLSQEMLLLKGGGNNDQNMDCWSSCDGGCSSSCYSSCNAGGSK